MQEGSTGILYSPDGGALPKATLSIELDNAQDCFEILRSEEDFGGNVKLGVKDNMLFVNIEADDAKELMSTIGNVVKQIRIIEETSDVIEPV